MIPNDNSHCFFQLKSYLGVTLCVISSSQRDNESAKSSERAWEEEKGRKNNGKYNVMDTLHTVNRLFLVTGNIASFKVVHFYLRSSKFPYIKCHVMFQNDMELRKHFGHR